MNLFHFTTLQALYRGREIKPGSFTLNKEWPNGIEPGHEQGRRHGHSNRTDNPGEDLIWEDVWLTSNPEPGRVGSPCDDEGSPTNCVRIAVRIPTTDRKLRRFRAEAKINGSTAWGRQVAVNSGDPNFWKRAGREWWQYRGVIGFNYIRRLEIIHGRQPWWTA